MSLIPFGNVAGPSNRFGDCVVFQIVSNPFIIMAFFLYIFFWIDVRNLITFTLFACEHSKSLIKIVWQEDELTLDLCSTVICLARRDAFLLPLANVDFGNYKNKSIRKNMSSICMLYRETYFGN